MDATRVPRVGGVVRSTVVWTVALLCLGAWGQLAADELESGDPPQLLLMRNGSVVRGKILAKGEDYLVAMPHGQMFVPAHLVRAACRDLDQAYQLLRERAAAQSEADAYLTLAKWCLSQNLFHESRESLEMALNLDPGRDEARELLVRTAELRREHEATRAEADEVKPAAHARTVDAVESLGGLRADLALQFTKRIQPILTNNCSLTGCHGPRSDNGFRLQRIALGVAPNRIGVEKNLANVLNQINVDEPGASPLLTIPRGNHGRAGKPVFRGPSGKDQIAELKRWVLEVAKEDVVRSRRRSPESAVQLVEGARDSAERKREFSAENPFGFEGADSDSRPPARLKPTGRSEGADQRDLFSPEEFNRARALRKRN